MITIDAKPIWIDGTNGSDPACSLSWVPSALPLSPGLS